MCLYGLNRIEATTLSKDVLKPISVIIAARNENSNLGINLPKILSQNYPEFEVIVVNDRSIDRSADTLRELSQKFQNLRVIEVRDEPTGAPKKNALSLGISSASFEHLAFTDADCAPINADWLRRIGTKFSDGSELVLGSGFFLPEKGLVNSLYRLESARIAALYFSSAWFGLPYMGVGRSMAYTKSAYERVNGFAEHAHVLSGDDDLMVQSLKGKVRIGLAPDAATLSRTPLSLHAWFSQKARHLSTGKSYPKSVLSLLGVYEFSNAIMTTTFLVCLLFASSTFILLASVLLYLRYFLFRSLLARLDSFLPKEYHHANLFLNDFILSILNPLFSMAAIWKNPSEWKKTI